MPKWNVSIAEESDRMVRRVLGRTGLKKKGDLSAFEEEAVKGEVLRRSARDLHERNPSLTEDDAQAPAVNLVAIECGMEDVRAGCAQPWEDALRKIADELT